MKLFVLLISMTSCIWMSISAQSAEQHAVPPSYDTFQEVETFGTKPSTRFAPGDVGTGETGQKVTEDDEPTPTPLGEAESLIYLALAIVASTYAFTKRTNLKERLQ